MQKQRSGRTRAATAAWFPLQSRLSFAEPRLLLRGLPPAEETHKGRASGQTQTASLFCAVAGVQSDVTNSTPAKGVFPAPLSVAALKLPQRGCFREVHSHWEPLLHYFHQLPSTDVFLP